MLKKKDVTKKLDGIEDDLRLVQLKMVHLEKMVLHLKGLTDKLSEQIEKLKCSEPEE